MTTDYNPPYRKPHGDVIATVIGIKTVKGQAYGRLDRSYVRAARRICQQPQGLLVRCCRLADDANHAASRSARPECYGRAVDEPPRAARQQGGSGMRTETQIASEAERALSRMLAGERVIVSEEALDHPVLLGRNDVATFFNENRAGILDAYVAWIGSENAPECIWRDAYGYGHASVESEVPA